MQSPYYNVHLLDFVPAVLNRTCIPFKVCIRLTRMPESDVYAKSESPTCQWCGKEMARQQGRGRRRKYCSQSCKQRAYEQRNFVAGTAIDEGAAILKPETVSMLRDNLFVLRCTAEDIRTAVDEGANPDELRNICDELIELARTVEKLR